MYHKTTIRATGKYNGESKMKITLLIIMIGNGKWLRSKCTSDNYRKWKNSGGYYKYVRIIPSSYLNSKSLNKVMETVTRNSDNLATARTSLK